MNDNSPHILKQIHVPHVRLSAAEDALMTTITNDILRFLQERGVRPSDGTLAMLLLVEAQLASLDDETRLTHTGTAIAILMGDYHVASEDGVPPGETVQ